MRILSILVFLALLCAMGCSPTVYAPNLQHVPNLRAKGDVEFQGGLLSTESTDGGGGAIAVAVSDQNGIGFNLNILSGNDDDNDGKLSSFQLYYIRQGLVSNNPKFMWGVSPGLGYTGMRWDSNNIDEFKSGYLQPFVVPSIGFVTPYFEVMASARFSYVGYLDNSFNPLSEQISERLQDQGNQFTFEPAFTIRGGWKYIRLQIQYVYSTYNADLLNISDEIEFDEFLSYDKSLFNFGLQFYLPHNSN